MLHCRAACCPHHSVLARVATPARVLASLLDASSANLVVPLLLVAGVPQRGTVGLTHWQVGSAHIRLGANHLLAYPLLNMKTS